MKVKLSVVLFLLLALINVSAQFKSTVARVSEAATLEEIGHPIDPQPLIDRFNKANGIDPTKFVNEPALLKKVTAYNVGDKKNLWSSNFVTKQFYLSPSTCRAVGTNCYIFVEDSMWTAGNVSQDAVNSVMNAFDNSTPANAAKGIYQTNVETFGFPPNVDGDSKIIIHILNIPDGYTGKAGEGYVAGYFYSVNQSTTHANSNKAEIYYLDCKPLNLLTANGLKTGMGTAAHEFQHMIMYNYHPGGQVTFFNEAWSLVAEVVCGYGLYGQSGTQGYSNNTNRYLLNWNDLDATDVLKDYSRAARFSLYLYEQFGADILKKYTQSVKTGVDAFDNDVFPKLGTTRRFADVLHDWFIANYVNDKNVSPGLTKYGYSYSPVAKVNPISTSLSSTVTTNEDAVNKAAAQYITFSSGKNITINFKSNTSAVKVKAVKIGSGTPIISDVVLNSDVNFSDFGTAYNSLTFIVYHNDANSTSGGPFAFTYSYSGTAASGTQELAYDSTEPVGFIQQTNGDSIAVKFDAVPGAKLDSIRIAIRNLVPINGRVLDYLGYTTQLGGTTYASFTATSKLTQAPSVIDQNGTYPYPQPYPNWTKVDLRSSNITSDKNFIVQFPIEDPYPSKNRVLSTYHPSTGVEHTVLYKASTETWGYSGVANLPDYSWACLIRAYVSYGTSDVSEPIEILPSSFTLSQNYPNPFNPSTVISYTLPKQSRVQIKIYDAIGNEIRSLIDEEKSAGKYNILWDSRNNYGTRVSSGVYFYKITADGFAQTKKMVLMK
ncbi:MAG: T9SS type A sorting domain-containing protein [Ignavibacteriales bacterium]|nr:T9SS type A sorting domain-containing protein [Ignavibacteriales bacterium]